MKFKLILFKCGCKYIWLHGKDRPYKVCPIHKRPVGSYVLWCIDCGLKIKAIPRAGYRQFRCVECRRKHEIKESTKWIAKNYDGKEKNEPTVHEQAEVKPPETQREEAKRQLNAWYLAMREMFKPPVWEGFDEGAHSL